MSNQQQSRFGERYGTYRTTSKSEIGIFLISLCGTIGSVPARQYWAGALFAILTITAACIYWSEVNSGYVAAYVLGREEGAADALREAEKRRLADARPCEVLAPTDEPPAGCGFLYVIKFSTGTIKVGQTRDLCRRLGEHWRDSSAYDVAIVNYWYSEPHANYLDNEVVLINGCRDLGNRARREYFHGADFDAVVQIAAQLPRVPDAPTPAGAPA